MTCFFCKADTFPNVTNHFVDIENCMMIIKNVPCLKCTQCGETYFDNSIVRTIEVIIDKLKTVSPEIGVYEYDKVVSLCVEKPALKQNIV